jgi:hypothetical protein
VLVFFIDTHPHLLKLDRHPTDTLIVVISGAWPMRAMGPMISYTILLIIIFEKPLLLLLSFFF